MKPETESNHLKATSLVPSIRLGHKHAKIAKTQFGNIYIYIHIWDLSAQLIRHAKLQNRKDLMI